MDWAVFVIAGAATLAGALGVIVYRNPVHAALSLVMTLFAVAVLFVAQEAHFLAAVQVIVYAGAIVVLFLFVIMLLGVDQSEDIATETLPAQRPLAALTAGLVLLEVLFLARSEWATGQPSVAGPAAGEGSNVARIAESLFTRYILAFEVTSILLVIAVVGAVVLARRSPSSGVATGGDDVDLPDQPPTPAKPAPVPQDEPARVGVVAGAEPSPSTPGSAPEPGPAPSPPPASEAEPARASSWVSSLSKAARGPRPRGGKGES